MRLDLLWAFGSVDEVTAIDALHHLEAVNFDLRVERQASFASTVELSHSHFALWVSLSFIK